MIEIKFKSITASHFREMSLFMNFTEKKIHKNLLSVSVRLIQDRSALSVGGYVINIFRKSDTLTRNRLYTVALRRIRFM